MNKILVELKLTEVPVQYNEQVVREGCNESTERFHNTLLVEHYIGSPYANHEEVLELHRQGFKKDYQDPISGNIIYTKREHYAFTNDTKKLLHKLYTEERQALEALVDKAESNALRMLDDAKRSQDELHKFIEATLWQRIKYLFGGSL